MPDKSREKKSATLSIIGFIMGVIGIIGSIALMDVWVIYPVAFFALLFGVIGLVKKQGGFAWGALILAILTFVLEVGLSSISTSSIDQSTKTFNATPFLRADVVAQASALDGSGVFNIESFNELGRFAKDINNEADWFRTDYIGTIYIYSLSTSSSEMLSIADQDKKSCAVFTFQGSREDENYLENVDNINNWDYRFMEYGESCKGYESRVTKDVPTPKEEVENVRVRIY